MGKPDMLEKVMTVRAINSSSVRGACNACPCQLQLWETACLAPYGTRVPVIQSLMGWYLGARDIRTSRMHSRREEGKPHAGCLCDDRP